MLLRVWLAVLPVVAQAQAGHVPQHQVAEPGVIATGQRVTAAGLQIAFAGRVAGLRFARGSDALWVAVQGSLYRLDWRANKVLGRAPIDGRPGIYAITVDSATGRAFLSSVSRLPQAMAASRLPGGDPLPPNGIVARLSAFDADLHGDGAAAALESPVLGDYMAGAPAIASGRGRGDRRVAVLPLPANDALAVLDAGNGALVKLVPLGVEPIAAVIAADGSSAYVSVLGGAKPNRGSRSATQCCDPRAEAVRVDAHGIADAGTVARVELETGTVTDITVGRHPTALVWDEKRDRLYVADGNSDSISVIDTQAGRVVASTAIAPFVERAPGLAPTALALAPDGHTLYVALGGANAVAMYDVGGSAAAVHLLGLIPTAWYPATLDASADGKYLAVGALLGMGSGSGKSPGSPGKIGRYVHAVRGSVSVLPVPTAAELAAFTVAVAANDRLTVSPLSGSAVSGGSAAPRPSAAPRAVPERPGEPSLVRHVVFIVRENRTYDQVLGDLGRGDGDSSLVIFGKVVTPNAHALAAQFVTLDRFFANGGNSADGHQWLTQANETEYPMWPLYLGRSYPSEGNDALAYSAGGFLWEAAQARGRTVSVFGEYAPAPARSSAAVRDSLLAAWRSAPDDFGRQRALLRTRYHTGSDIPSLDRVLVREYPGWTEEAPDVVKAGDVLAHLADWEQAHAMPALTMIVLPSDHTQGTSPGWCTPRACVADNDYALGRIVEGLSRSSFWRDMAILVVEDDAQDGVDHVDGHRTVALVASPYARRGIVDSTFYTQTSMVKTIELMLGLPALSVFDLVATDMRASFIGAGEQPDLSPFTAVVPAQSLEERNLATGEITGPRARERRRAARASARMRFDVPDAAPSEALDRILWSDARGWKAPYPGTRRALFFPMAIDISDSERDTGEPARHRRRR